MSYSTRNWLDVPLVHYFRHRILICCCTVVLLIPARQTHGCDLCDPPLVSVPVDVGTGYGSMISRAGDFNGDGVQDFVVRRTTGGLRIVSGVSPYLTMFTFASSQAPCGGCGLVADNLGNFNGDAYDDIIVGESWHGSGELSNRGKFLVFAGRSWSPPLPVTLTDGDATYVRIGGSDGEGMGAAVSGAGDVNNDGTDDYIVGASGHASRGRAYVYSGLNGSLLYYITAANLGDALGGAVTEAGDANNDGFADFVVTANEHKFLGASTGRAYMFSGDFLLNTLTGPFPRHIDLSLAGAEAAFAMKIFSGEGMLHRYGLFAAFAGDANGDGYDDVLIGAPGLSSTQGDPSLHGKAYVITGKPGIDIVYSYTGQNAVDVYGSAVASAGDIDGDGLADFLVGAPLNDAGGNNSGTAYLYSGVDGSLICEVNGDNTHDWMGSALVGTETALVLGAPGRDAGGGDDNIGATYFYSCATPACCVIAGDADGSGSITIGDVTHLISYIFAGGSAPGCCEEGDANGSGSITIGDVTYLLARIFSGGPAPICGPAGMACTSE